MQNGWADRVLQEEELFDLVFDPNETNNLSGDPRSTQGLEEMRQRLDRWMESTQDPLLDGPVPALQAL